MISEYMQILTVIVNIYISLTERKTRIYVATFILNLAQLIMYFVTGDFTTGLIYIIITTRSLIYIFKDKFKTDILPYSVILIQLAIGFFTIQSPLQIMSILIPCYSCYYLWFEKDTQGLRIGNIIANSLWAIYNALNGLYIILIMRAITILSNIFGYVKKLYEDTKLRKINQYFNEQLFNSKL